MTATFEELERKVLAQFESEGVPAKDVELARTLGVRYRLQTNTINVDVDPGPLDEQGATRIIERFVERYGYVYGEGALLDGGTLEFEQHRVVGTQSLDRVRFPEAGAAGADAAGAVRGIRRAYFEPDGFQETTVYDGARLRAGNVVPGPAIVDRMGDSTVVPPGVEATVDRLLTMRLRQTSASAPADTASATEVEALR